MNVSQALMGGTLSENVQQMVAYQGSTSTLPIARVSALRHRPPSSVCEAGA